MTISQLSDKTLVMFLEHMMDLPVSDGGLIMQESLKRLMVNNRPERLNPKASKEDVIV